MTDEQRIAALAMMPQNELRTFDFFVSALGGYPHQYSINEILSVLRETAYAFCNLTSGGGNLPPFAGYDEINEKTNISLRKAG